MRLAMHLAAMSVPATTAADLDRLGDEIAVLSAHLDAAMARLLTLLREFDRGAAGPTASAPAPNG